MRPTNGRETDREWGTSIQMDATVKERVDSVGILSASTCQGANAKTFDPNGSQRCHHKGCWLFIVLNQSFLCVTPQALTVLCNHNPLATSVALRLPSSVKALIIEGVVELICAKACVAEAVQPRFEAPVILIPRLSNAQPT